MIFIQWFMQCFIKFFFFEIICIEKVLIFFQKENYERYCENFIDFEVCIKSIKEILSGFKVGNESVEEILSDFEVIFDCKMIKKLLMLC